jgi:hypothetical protein
VLAIVHGKNDRKRRTTTSRGEEKKSLKVSSSIEVLTVNLEDKKFARAASLSEKKPSIRPERAHNSGFLHFLSASDAFRIENSYHSSPIRDFFLAEKHFVIVSQGATREREERENIALHNLNC